MTEVLCERTLHGVATDRGKTCEVRLYKPSYIEAEQCWICRVEFAGASVRPLNAHGLDGFQALAVALGTIGKRLEETGARLVASCRGRA